MANHRIYQYTSIGRPLDPAYPSNKAVLVLMPLAAVMGAMHAWLDGGSLADVLAEAFEFLLILFGSWALARELDPDDNPAAFVSAALAMLAAFLVDEPGVLIVFSALLLVRTVNRSTGLESRLADSLIVTALAIWTMYATAIPFYGAVAGLAFILDGSLREPLRRQWIFGLICLAGSVVYMVDHDYSLAQLSAPATLFEWLSLVFLLMFALDALLLKKVHAHGDTDHRRLDVNRVRGGMGVGILAALAGFGRPQVVVIIVAVIAGLCIGMALRKGFKAPVHS